MRILVLCPHFAPDTAPTGTVMTGIVDGLGALGHRLHVVTSSPWYEHHRVESDWQGTVVHHATTGWGTVSRVHPFPGSKTNLVSRAIGFAGFTGLSGLTAAMTASRPEVVLAMSPPITLGVAGVAVGRMRRIPVVFNVQDIFPDVAVDLGMLTDPRLIAVARALERSIYAASDAVTVLSDDLRANVVAKLRPDTADKVRVIPNFVDTARIVPADPHNDYRVEHGLVGRRVVLYAGNVGHSQSLDLVIDAARAFRADPSVVFVINGQGSARAALEQTAAGLDNVVFVDYQPAERLGEVLAAGDIHVVPLRRGLASASVPSKIYSILAAGRPFVASVDEGTEIDRIAQASGAGLAVPPDDPAAFTAALRRLLDDDEAAGQMGRAGRRWVEGWASPAAVAALYADLFTELVAAHRR
jgi:colanic acid biosynthesis glycosyl transferase WcaI